MLKVIDIHAYVIPLSGFDFDILQWLKYFSFFVIIDLYLLIYCSTYKTAWMIWFSSSCIAFEKERISPGDVYLLKNRC